jgi:hypothetical protein
MNYACFRLMLIMLLQTCFSIIQLFFLTSTDNRQLLCFTVSGHISLESFGAWKYSSVFWNR